MQYLGSVELISTTAGAVRARLSFAAYGERRDTDWAGPVSAADLATLGATTREGFTGQVQLDALGLIGFPGRVYDPAVGRFLSRDPLIDGRAASQGANGYAYVWNNPLSLTDPSGYQVESTVTVTVTARRIDAAGPSLGGGGNLGGGGGAPPSEPGEREGAVTLEDGLETVTVTAPHWRAPPPPVITVVALSSSRLPQDQKPFCEGGPQILDPSLTALSASAATIANNSTGEIPPFGSRGVDPVTSARIAPFEQLAAKTDWAGVAKVALRASWALNVANIGVGFRSSVSDGMYAVTDFAVSVAVPFVPWVGIPASIAYGAHGGSEALVNDVKYITGSCRRQ